MSVYQGARLRTARFPAVAETTRPAVALPKAPAARGDKRGITLVGMIVVATVVGFAFLTQTLGANASSAEMNTLAAKREVLESQLLTQRAAIVQRTTEVVIEEWAAASGLIDLGDPLIVSLP